MSPVPTRLPQVAVIILSHRERFAPEALASVFEQTYRRDHDVQIVLQHAKAGWNEKLNAAVNATVSEFVVILCDDDLLAPDFLERVMAVAERGRGADLVFTDRMVFLDGSDPRAGVRHREFPEHQDSPSGYFDIGLDPAGFEDGSTLPMTCLIRRSLWDQLRGYDATIPQMDTEFFYRAVEAQARYRYVPFPGFYWRRHEDQLSQTEPSMIAFLRAFHRKHFLRFGLDYSRAVYTGIRTGGEQSWLVPFRVPEGDRAEYLLDPEHYIATHDLAPTIAEARSYEQPFAEVLA